MVTVVTAFGRTGLQDWVVQRVTAVLLFVYFFIMLGFFILTPNISFEVWKGFFDYLFIKVFTLLVLLSLVVHAWIGIWTVITDYIKIFYLRLVSQLVVNLLLIGYLVVGIESLWGF